MAKNSHLNGAFSSHRGRLAFLVDSDKARRMPLITDASILIDAQMYIDIYRTHSGKHLLGLLAEVKDYIFVTEQLVQEVNKHKLPEALGFLKQCQIGKPAGCKLPDHLFDESGAIADEIHEKLGFANEKIMEANRVLEKSIADTLRRISLSEDVTSKALAPLFNKAVKHTSDELERATIRKARGIPPGKNADPLGDQLTWEQFLAFVKKTIKRRIWIISRDSDYCIQHCNEAFLNPILNEELRALRDPAPEVHTFANIPDAIKHFSQVTGIKADQMPSPEKVKEIKEEQESLPTLDWPDVGRIFISGSKEDEIYLRALANLVRSASIPAPTAGTAPSDSNKPS